MPASSENEDRGPVAGATVPGGQDAPDTADSTSAPPAPLRITGWGSGGEGVGRLADGRVVFVDGAVPGDLVLPTEIVVRKKMASAKIGQVIEPSADRVSPACIHFEECGGCAWQHVAYSAQLEAKREHIRNALTRIGRIDFASEIDIVASPNAYGYRARARLVEADTGVGYRKRGAHISLAIQECPVLVPPLQERLALLSQELKAGAAVAATEVEAKEAAAKEAAAAAEKEEAAEGAEGQGQARRRRTRAKEWVLTASGAAGETLAERVSGSARKTSGGRGRGGSSGRRRHASTGKSASSEHVLLEVLGEKLRASGSSFVQGNALLWDEFARVVVDATLAGNSPTRFVELYAGIGFFTLPLARAGLSGVAIESDGSATADLRWNLEQAKLQDRVKIVTARAEKRGDLAQQFARGDVLLVDPPRLGLDRVVRDAILASGPKRLVYVSCDPGTWARDVGELAKSDYRLAKVQAFDLFPQTPHVEIVSQLERV